MGTPLLPPRHRGASAARPNQASDSSLPSTRRRVHEGASRPLKLPLFSTCDWHMAHGTHRGLTTTAPYEFCAKAPPTRRLGVGVGFGFGFGFGNPKSHQSVYLLFSLGFGVRGSAPPCGWVAESPPTGDIPESPPLQIQARRGARSRPPQEKGQPPERSPLMHERPD